MTQERYQEAAEWLKGDALGWRKNSHLHAIDTPWHKESVGIAEKVELAAEVLTKLASGWVLVPGNPVAWITEESMRQLERGGNGSRGTAPIHVAPSSIAKRRVYIAAELDAGGTT